MRRAIDADTQHAAGALKGGSRGDDKILWSALLRLFCFRHTKRFLQA